MPFGTLALSNRRFAPLFAAQFMGALNDNLMKTAVSILLLFGASGSALTGALATGLFVLPYVLFASMAGRLADRYPKSKVAFWIKCTEVPVMTLAGIGVSLDSMPLMLAAVFLAGCQATFFSPVKFALLPELLDEEEIVAGNAYIESGTFFAILLGTILGGTLVAYAGAALVAWVMPAISLAGLAAMALLPATSRHDADLTLGWPSVRQARDLVVQLSATPQTKAAGLGLSWFWMIGAILLAQVPAYAHDVLRASESAPTVLLAMLSIGIALGSIAYRRIAKSPAAVAAVPAGFLIMAGGIGGLLLVWPAQESTTLIEFLSSPSSWLAMIAMLVTTFGGGLATLPLYIALQEGGDPSSRARIIAANNLLNAVWMVAGTAAAASVLAGVHSLGFDDMAASRIVLGLTAASTVLAGAVFSRHAFRAFRFVPAGLIALRFALGPICVMLAVFQDRLNTPGYIYAVLIVTGLLSDIFDGIIARRIGVATPRLRRFDSQTDILFWLCLLVAATLTHPDLLAAHRYGILSLLGIEAACYAVSFLRFGRETCTHAYSAKLYGIGLGVGLTAILGFGAAGFPVRFMIATGWVAGIDVILITLLLPAWRHDVISCVHALRERRRSVAPCMNNRGVL